MKINTRIPATKKRLEIIGSVIGQLSDGIWENTRSMEKYWKSLSYEKGADGMLYLEDRHFVCSDLRDYFANKIKQIIKIEAEHNNPKLEWDRSCSVLSEYLSYTEDITVGDCYELYELLKGRDTSKYIYAQLQDYSVRLMFDKLDHVMVVKALSTIDAKKKALAKLCEHVTAVVALA